MRVHVLTNIPSYHQVDLFDAIAASEGVGLFVTYLRRMTPGRQWARLPVPRHPHAFLPIRFDRGVYFVNPGLLGHLRSVPADLLVVTQYAGLSYLAAMARATLLGRPWVFWSEAPGVRHFEVSSGVPEMLRPLARRIALLPIRLGAREVWGVGGRAAAEYGRLTGKPTRNLPYYSNLVRFGRGAAPHAPEGRLRFLFAGRYSFRKGFDLLCEAFARLATERDGGGAWELTTCGDGELRRLIRDRRELAGRVRDLGFQELDAMPGVMRNHDVLVFPSRYDGWGMVLPEALAAGLRVIASDEVGAALEFSERDSAVLRFRAGDVAGLLARLREAVANDGSAAALARVAVEEASRFDARTGARVFGAAAEAALSGALEART